MDRSNRQLSTTTIGGAVVAAIAASACCLGPAVLGIVGLSGVGFAARLEPLRPYFLAATAALLGLGFYFTYRRPRAVASDGSASGDEACCAVPSPAMRRTARAGRLMLWGASALVVALAAYPYLARAMHGHAAASATGDTGDTRQLVVVIEGMSCAACGGHIEGALARLPGVVRSQVDFDHKQANVVYVPAQVTPARIVSAISDVGYPARESK